MSDIQLQNLTTGGGKHPWIDGAPPRTFAAWLIAATTETLLAEASFLVPRLTLGGLESIAYKASRQFYGLTVWVGLFVVLLICLRVVHALIVHALYGFVVV